jgi:hypothetical protein
MTWSLEEEEGNNNSMSSKVGEVGFGLLQLFDWQVQFYHHIPVTEQY